METRYWKEEDLTTLTIKLKIKENFKYNFCGNAYYNLKYSYTGGKTEYSWKPLSIEVTFTDDDDYGIFYYYEAKNKDEFNSIINDIQLWMNKINNFHIGHNQYYNTLSKFPHYKKFERAF